MSIILIKEAAPQTYGSRGGVAIDMCVLHVTESSTFQGTLDWFATLPTGEHGQAQPHPVAAAHYLIGSAGQVALCVPKRLAAFHAGNGPYNRRSIGIEIVGYSASLTMPDAQFTALVELVVETCKTYAISIDRKHILGHAEVPNPNDPTKFGGINGHTDPGPRFDWPRLMNALAAQPSSTTTLPVCV